MYTNQYDYPLNPKDLITKNSLHLKTESCTRTLFQVIATPMSGFMVLTFQLMVMSPEPCTTTLFQVIATPVSVFMVLTFQLTARSPSQTPSSHHKNQYSTSNIHTCLCTTLVGEMEWLKYRKTRTDGIVEEEKVTVL